MSDSRHVAPADNDRPVDFGRVENGERVLGELGAYIVLVVGRPIGAAVAARVEGHDAGVARQEGDLHLPAARVDDLPRRQEKDGRSPSPYRSQNTRTPSRST